MYVAGWRCREVRGGREQPSSSHNGAATNCNDLRNLNPAADVNARLMSRIIPRDTYRLRPDSACLHRSSTTMRKEGGTATQSRDVADAAGDLSILSSPRHVVTVRWLPNSNQGASFSSVCTRKDRNQNRLIPFVKNYSYCTGHRYNLDDEDKGEAERRVRRGGRVTRLVSIFLFFVHRRDRVVRVEMPGRKLVELVLLSIEMAEREPEEESAYE